MAGSLGGGGVPTGASDDSAPLGEGQYSAAESGRITLPVSRWKSVLLVLLVASSILGAIFWTTAPSSGRRRGEGSGWIDIGHGPMLVRIRVHVVDAEGRPVAGARVVQSQGPMSTDRDIDLLQRTRITPDLAKGFRAGSRDAIGTTNSRGVAVLEYIAGEGSELAWVVSALPGEFPFAWWIRVDSPACGTIIRPLDDPRNIHFDLHPGPIGRGRYGEIMRVGEADFQVRCDK